MVDDVGPKWTWATAQLRGSIKDARTARKILESGDDEGRPLSPDRRVYLEGVVEEGVEAAVQLREHGYVVEDP